MALTGIYGYRPYVAPTPTGLTDQNALYRQLSQAAYAPPVMPDFSPVQGSFGMAGPSPGTDNGVVSLPGGPVQPKGTQVAPPVGSPQSGPPVNNTTTNPNNNTSSSSSNLNNLDFSGDPMLARIRALNQQNIADAEASALAQKKRELIGYGYDPALQSLYPDQSTIAAAQQNPFSTLAQLLFQHQQRSQNLTEAENKANLFYSGERIKQTGLEGRAYTQEQSQAGSALQNMLNQIAQAVLNSRMAAQGAELQGESDAYNRAIEFALANNTGYPGGGGTSGGGGGGDNYLGIPAGSQAGQGETRNVTSASQLDTSGGWGVHWDGPGTYTPVKIHSASGHSDTVWVKTG